MATVPPMPTMGDHFVGGPSAATGATSTLGDALMEQSGTPVTGSTGDSNVALQTWRQISQSMRALSSGVSDNHQGIPNALQLIQNNRIIIMQQCQQSRTADERLVQYLTTAQGHLATELEQARAEAERQAQIAAGNHMQAERDA